jgi:hypothetical protein
MRRSSTSRRRVVGLALGLSVAAGLGLGLTNLFSASGATASPVPRAASATPPSRGLQVQDLPTADTAPVPAAGPAPTAGPASAPLTFEEATAVATQFAPGRVVEVDQDSEPTGLEYEVTVAHDNGTATKVEVDAASGRVVGSEVDDWDGN